MFARRLLVASLAFASAAAGPGCAAEAASQFEASDALQVLADLTLIDGTCRDDTVNFGIAFRFATGKGVADTAVLPGGARRAEFEATLRARRASFNRDELCGEIAANYAEALPGSVSIRPGIAVR